MYKILVDNILMCDSRVEELALLNPVVTLEENKAGSFTFKIPPNHPCYDLIQRRKSVVQVFQDDDKEPLFSGMCIEISNDFYKQKEIYCEGELSYFNDSIQRQARYQDVTVRGLLENLIAKHNEQVEETKRFAVGIVTAADVNDSLYCYTNMESTMKCLKEDLVDDLGGFFRVRHADGVKYLDYLAGSQNTNSQIIKLGKNLLDFSSNIDSSEIATAIIPLGAKLEEETEVEGLEKRLTIESVNGGKDFIYSQEAVNNFGWIYTVVTWDDVTTAAALKSKAEKYLSEIQFENMVIEAKAVDLHLDNKAIERFKLSDEIRVVSKPHGLDKYFRLTKMTINLNNPESNTITLGKEENVGLSAKTNQENSEIKSAIESFSANAILNSAIANATQLIKQSMNGYITTVTNGAGVPTELLIMDTPDKATATKVWRWNINGLGYSKNGYNGDYELAMTMDGGFVADFITSGTMKANRIKGGELTLGGSDNTSGVLNLFNALGKSIVKLDKEGITLADGASLISASGVCGDLTFVSNGGSPEWLGFRPDSLGDGGADKATLILAVDIPENFVIKSATLRLMINSTNGYYYYPEGGMSNFSGFPKDVKAYVGDWAMCREYHYPGSYYDLVRDSGEQIISGDFVADGYNFIFQGDYKTYTAVSGNISSMLKNGINMIQIIPGDFSSENEVEYLHRTGTAVAIVTVKGYTKN